MRLPAIRGIMDRRILANFHVDPDVMARVLPAPFRPLVINGYSIGGICLIRLKSARPRLFPSFCGLRSENAAHRIAVEWDQAGETRQGVYIPRRDTDSRLNVFAGNRVFGGVQHRARFSVSETSDTFSVTLESVDGITKMHIAGTVTDRLPESSVFSSIAEASEFFKRGSLGYAATGTQGRYDGLECNCHSWKVEPLEVSEVESSFFGDESVFPRGSVAFDCALLMRDIDHEWIERGELCCPSNVAT